MAVHPDDDDKTRSFTPLTSGTEVGHYRIIEKIGAGGMGEVYLAQDTRLNRRVALKFLPTHLCQDEECRQRFSREAQSAAGLDHPNIAAIYEVGEHSGRPFYSMQLVEGQSLRDAISGKDLSISRVLEVAVQVCEGLQAAHDRGIIHRDIKPSNILIDGHGRVRIVDFGLAAVSGSKHLTQTGSTLGTIGYMSPEQVQGKDVDHRSDLFSLGVILYELVSKRNPFRRDSEAATLKAVSDDMPEPLSRYKSGVSGELQRIVSKLLEKNPQLRFQSAADAVSDLKRLTTSETLSGKLPVRKDWWNRFVVTGASILLVILAGYWLLTKYAGVESGDVKTDRTMLAVLPFENLGDPDDEYFADGITDEITSRVASFHEIGVISRTSAMQYKGAMKSLREIGRELGVDYILEGTIRWDKSDSVDRIRITPQLIDAHEDRHVWADNYERSLTQVFEIQSDIATQIANALNVTLLGSEKSAIANWPTANLEAYDYYLRGRDYAQQLHPRTQEMFEKAIELDSSFALAYSELSRVHSYSYWIGIDQSSDRIELARNLAETALKLAPESAEGHLAMGYYHYYGSRDFPRALEEFEIALRDQPNNGDMLAAIAYVKRRQGKWHEAHDLLKRSVKLDPASVAKATNYWQVCNFLRKYDEVVNDNDRMLARDPDNIAAWISKILTVGLFIGDTASARVMLTEAESRIGRSNMPGMLWHFDVSVGDFETALQRATRSIDAITSATDSADYYLFHAETYHVMGETVRSIQYFDSVRLCLEYVVSSDSVLGHFPGARMNLAKAYARLGRSKDAIALAQKSKEELPRTEDAYTGTNILREYCMVNMMAGNLDEAIDILDTLLSIPSDVNTVTIQLHPGMRPFHDHPRFQELIDKYEKIHGIGQ